VSTRVEGAEPPVIRVTARAALVAGTVRLTLSVDQETETVWKYTLSEWTAPRRAFGRVVAEEYLPGLRRAAVLLADGYAPGSTERGLLETFAEDEKP
jgi:hypothetical protein